MSRALCVMACLLFAARAWSAEPKARAPAPLPEPVTAADFFNRGGAQFCRNQMEEAKKTVEDGLARYPDDAALQKLKKLLDQPPQQQQNEDQQDQQDSSKSKDRQDQDSKSKQDEQKSKEEQDKDQQQQQQKDQSKPGDAKPEQPQPREGQLTQDQIARLLEAASQEEMNLRDVLRQQQPRESPPVDKDW